MSELWLGSRAVSASRKPYLCGVCGRTMPPGTRYVRSSYVEDETGKFFMFRLHAQSCHPDDQPF